MCRFVRGNLGGGGIWREGQKDDCGRKESKARISGSCLVLAVFSRSCCKENVWKEGRYEIVTGKAGVQNNDPDSLIHKSETNNENRLIGLWNRMGKSSIALP